MRASNTERLTPLGGKKWGFVGQLVLLGLLLLGPENLARLISGLTSIITFPITQELSFDSNRYEVFNLELLMIYIIAVLGLNLLMQTGLISIGTTASFAFGAYFTGIATVELRLELLSRHSPPPPCSPRRSASCSACRPFGWACSPSPWSRSATRPWPPGSRCSGST